ncbi:hypothetical protein, partial [Escherichia coli]|uniref:hypothetical protein n=1 Tax=Escherichia coli TaxID=562 RepID=UPI002283B207
MMIVIYQLDHCRVFLRTIRRSEIPPVSAASEVDGVMTVTNEDVPRIDRHLLDVLIQSLDLSYDASN